MQKPFTPEFLPIKLSKKDIIEILKLEVEARSKITKFNSILERSIIKKELLMLFSLQESVQSTKIEGTQASFDEVMESESTGKTNADIVEVVNYYQAITQAQDLLNRMPISTRMFHKLHSILLKGSRGENRSPGSYRKIQNFIGPTNKIEDATYIPPEPHLIDKYMSNLERYINKEYDDDLGEISQTAIIHGQFETIHPYLDGNGRLGRILIIICLLDKGIISYPAFFVSEELERKKYKYYALLNNLRLEEPQWKKWIIFFLNSSIKQADIYIQKLLLIEDLYKKTISVAEEYNIPSDAVLFIFNKPIFTIPQMQENIGVSYNTARRYILKLANNDLLYGDDKKRNRIYRFYDLMDIIIS